MDRLDQRRLAALLLCAQAIALFAMLQFGTPFAAYLLLLYSGSRLEL
jgi:hypothetical protein